MTETVDGGVLITGGGSGLGEALAAEFMDNDWQVVILGRDEVRTGDAADRLTETHGAEDNDCLYTVADVTNEAQMKTDFSEAEAAVGGLSVVVHGAAMLNVGRITETNADDDAQMLLTNVMGPRNALVAAEGGLPLWMVARELFHVATLPREIHAQRMDLMAISRFAKR